MMRVVILCAWSLAVSAGYALLALVAPTIAAPLVVAFVALLLVPEGVATWKRRGG